MSAWPPGEAPNPRRATDSTHPSETFRPPVRLRTPQYRARPEHTFKMSSLWTALGAYAPGLGLLKAGWRRAGSITLGVYAGIVGLLLIWTAFDRGSLMKLGVNIEFLKAMIVLLPLLALGWAGLIAFSHLELRPQQLTKVQRALGSVLVGFLCLTITAPLAVAARYSFDQVRLLESLFRHGSDIRSGTAPSLQAGDPWKNKPRVNILLLGGDAGKDRTGTRTDTVILASIDTKTGDTVLISLPRNTAKMPFPADSPLHQHYPAGFTSSGYGGDLDYMLTEMYETLPDNVPPDILGPTDNLGADALKLSVGEATGLKVDYYMLIELDGFRELINALGGVTVNINQWVAIGGQTDLGIKPDGALRPGPNQHLNGAQALWFARGRYGADDFQRMDRQRCVIQAIIKQANPANMLTRYEAIARSGNQLVQTDMPQELLGAMVDLSNRVKSGKATSLVFKNAEHGFYSSNPDFNLVRDRVRVATTKQPKAQAEHTPLPGQSFAPRPQPSLQVGNSFPIVEGPRVANPVETPAAPLPGADDLDASCAYKPEIAEAQPPKPPWEM